MRQLPSHQGCQSCAPACACVLQSLIRRQVHKRVHCWLSPWLSCGRIMPLQPQVSILDFDTCKTSAICKSVPVCIQLMVKVVVCILHTTWLRDILLKCHVLVQVVASCTTLLALAGIDAWQLRVHLSLKTACPDASSTGIYCSQLGKRQRSNFAQTNWSAGLLERWFLDFLDWRCRDEPSSCTAGCAAPKPAAGPAAG